MSSWLTTYVKPSTFSLLPKAYHLQPQTTTYNLPPCRQGGSDKLYSFLEFKFLESDRPSSSPVELPGTMLSIEWCRDQGLLTRAWPGSQPNAIDRGGGGRITPPQANSQTNNRSKTG